MAVGNLQKEVLIRSYKSDVSTVTRPMVQVLWGVTEGAGMVQTIRDEAQGKLHYFLQQKGGCSGVGVGLYCQVTAVRREVMAPGEVEVGC